MPIVGYIFSGRNIYTEDQDFSLSLVEPLHTIRQHRFHINIDIFGTLSFPFFNSLPSYVYAHLVGTSQLCAITVMEQDLITDLQALAIDSVPRTHPSTLTTDFSSEFRQYHQHIQSSHRPLPASTSLPSTSSQPSTSSHIGQRIANRTAGHRDQIRQKQKISAIKRRPKGISLKVLTGDAVSQAIKQETPRQQLCRRLFGDAGDSEHEADEEDENEYFQRVQRSRELYFMALAARKLSRNASGKHRVLMRMARE